MRFLSQVELRISAFSQLFSPQSQVVSQLFRGLYVVRAHSFCSSPFNVVADGGSKGLCDLNPRRQLIHIDETFEERHSECPLFLLAGMKSYYRRGSRSSDQLKVSG